MTVKGLNVSYDSLPQDGLTAEEYMNVRSGGASTKMRLQLIVPGELIISSALNTALCTEAALVLLDAQVFTVQGADPEYLMWALRSPDMQAWMAACGGHPLGKRSDFLYTGVSLPDPDTQREIARTLGEHARRADEMLQVLKDHGALTQERLNARVSEAFKPHLNFRPSGRGNRQTR